MSNLNFKQLEKDLDYPIWPEYEFDMQPTSFTLSTCIKNKNEDNYITIRKRFSLGNIEDLLKEALTKEIEYYLNKQ